MRNEQIQRQNKEKAELVKQLRNQNLAKIQKQKELKIERAKF